MPPASSVARLAAVHNSSRCCSCRTKERYGLLAHTTAKRRLSSISYGGSLCHGRSLRAVQGLAVDHSGSVSMGLYRCQQTPELHLGQVWGRNITHYALFNSNADAYKRQHLHITVASHHATEPSGSMSTRGKVNPCSGDSFTSFLLHSSCHVDLAAALLLH